MTQSGRKCPQCGQKVFISNGGDYWCSTCQQWQDARQVDPQNVDVARLKILAAAVIERAE